jgi:hypothetical protein
MFLSISSEPWKSVSMNFMMQFFKWNMNAILVVVDKLFKLTKMAPTKIIVATFDWTKLFYDIWVRHHGVLQFIVSDRDAKISTNFLKHLFWKVGKKIVFNIILHPQIDGQTKKSNGYWTNILENMWVHIKEIGANIQAW